MGVVYHGNYLAFFETGRVEAFRQVGALYGNVMGGGVHLPVVEAHLRYHQPARFDDVLLIHVQVDDVGASRFAFRYEIKREGDDATIATGRTVHACVDTERLRPIRMPATVRGALERLRGE